MEPALRHGDSPFDLLEVVGRGGMGVVWRARHHLDGEELALKLLVGPSVDEGALRRELEATSALYHPQIVAVHDYGRLPDSWSPHPDRPPGAPFIAMELLTGGSLADHGGTLHWTGVRTVLLGLLDALGHAHARGVVHLDVKPANVLRDVDGEWRLVDFGIARAASEPGRVVGTVPYMAPEQLRGDAPMLGPHSDLFALGTMGWRLVTGSLPREGTPNSIFSQALAGTPSAFEPRFRVPEELEAWLRALMEPDPHERVRVAADAAHALASMPEFAASPEGVVGPSSREVSSTFTLDAVTTPLQEITARKGGARRAASLAPPPFVSTWQQPSRPRQAPTSLGLGLFGVRPMPFVGRVPERELLFSELARVHSGERRWVHLAGGAGLGRSRLGLWLCQRACELGVASVWAPGPGSEGMRHSLLDGLGSPGPRVLARLLGVSTDSARVSVLQAWLAGDSTPGLGVCEQLYVQALSGTCATRPAVLWLDDAGPDAMRLVDLLGSARVLVLTASDGPRREADTRVRLEALADPEVRSLLNNLLGLEEGLAHQLAAHSQGSPRYLHQLLALLISRGALVPGPDGYVLAEGETLGSSAGAVGLETWLDKPGDRDAIELAAVLGIQIREAEWRRALQLAGLLPSEDLVDRGARLGWVRRHSLGWAFVDTASHARLSQTKRAERWHRVALQLLDPLTEPRKFAQHLLALGETEEAIPHLRRHAMRVNEAGDTSGARRLFHELSVRYLEAGDRGRYAEMRGWEAWMAYQVGEMEEGRRLADEVLSLGSRLQDSSLIASGAHTKGVIEGALCTAAAAPLLMRAARLYRQVGKEALASQAEGSAWCSQPATDESLGRLAALVDHAPHPLIGAMAGRCHAQALLRAGRPDQALQVARSSHQAFSETKVHQGLSAVGVQIGHAHISLGDLDAGRSAYYDALGHVVDESGGRHVEITLFVGLAELLLRNWRDGARMIRSSARRLRRFRWVEHTTASRFGQVVLLAWQGEAEAFELALIETSAAERGQAFAGEFPVHLLLGLAAEIWEEQGDQARAELCWRSAAEVAERTGRGSPELYHRRLGSSESTDQVSVEEA